MLVYFNSQLYYGDTDVVCVLNNLPYEFKMETNF